MIVRYHSDGTVVMITQNDHARLSGLFAAHWGNAQFEPPRPYAAVVRAAHYHDSGWFRYETNPQFDSASRKTPSYRALPHDAAQLASYQWGIDMLSGVDRYTGLLASKHRTGLWQTRYGVMTQPPPRAPRTLSPDVQAFIARNETQQTALADGLDRHEVTVNYNLLQVWDLISLYICSSEELTDEFIAPVPTGYGDTDNSVAMRLRPLSPARIAINPFPFTEEPLIVSLVHRQLSQVDLRDEDTFHAGYFRAQPQIATYSFVVEDSAED
jgi:Protein of unknown function (DUF3891)